MKHNSIYPYAQPCIRAINGDCGVRAEVLEKWKLSHNILYRDLIVEHVYIAISFSYTSYYILSKCPFSFYALTFVITKRFCSEVFYSLVFSCFLMEFQVTAKKNNFHFKE